jgi:hypothetical protein
LQMSVLALQVGFTCACPGSQMSTRAIRERSGANGTLEDESLWRRSALSDQHMEVMSMLNVPASNGGW